MNAINRLKEAMGTVINVMVFIAILVVGMFGNAYWLWMSFQLGSFWMFFWGILAFLIPPYTARTTRHSAAFFCAILIPFSLMSMATPYVAIYAFFFGIPDWIINWFG